MPTDAVWISVILPSKDYEKLTRLKREKEKLRQLEANCPHHGQANHQHQSPTEKGYMNGNLNIIFEDNNNLHTKADQEPYLEKILEEALADLEIDDAAWMPSRSNKFYQVYFACHLDDSEAIVDFLRDRGFGSKLGTSIGFIPFDLYWQDDEEEEDFDDVFAGKDEEKELSGFKEVQKKFLESVTSRLTVAQVIEGVRGGAELTFDFVFYTIFAGWIACNGLVNTQPVDIAASMMIEPIMGTVMAVTFGTIVRDKPLIVVGVRSLIASLIICLFTGYIYGMIAFNWRKEIDPPPDGVFPTPEMVFRGTTKALWYGTLIALPAGGAVALSLLNNNFAVLVGVAVASTFLPPMCNAGLLWALATHIEIDGIGQEYRLHNRSGEEWWLRDAWLPMEGYEVIYSRDMRVECGILSGISIAYTMINVVCMFLFCIVMLKIKEVAPLGKAAKHNKRFFKEHIKNFRDYRKSIAAGAMMRSESMGDQILKEWAEISGLDAKQLLSDTPEAKVTQLQTLQDIVMDVENDETFQNVVKNAVGQPEPNSLLRRLTRANLGPMPPNSLQTRRKTRAMSIFDVESGVRSPRNSTKLSSTSSSGEGRGGRMNVAFNDSVTEIAADGSRGSIVRGLKPQNFAGDAKRRQSRVALQKQLQDSDHSPYSIWPTKRGSDVSGPRRRVSLHPNARRKSQAPARMRLSSSDKE